MKDQSRDASNLLSAFSVGLGWDEVERHEHVLDDLNMLIVFYTCGVFSCEYKTHIALQINEHPIGASGTFAAEVRCLPYKLRSGWRKFSCVTMQLARVEAERLHSWLERDWFLSIKGRRQYRIMHPECANYTGIRTLEDFKKFGHLETPKSD